VRVTITSFASSFETGDPQPVSAGETARVDAGPGHSPTAKTGVGFTGLRALRYAAGTDARTVLFDVEIAVTGHTELSYVVMPASDEQPTYRSTFVALDVEFDEGPAGISAKEQGESKRLYLDQWNLVRHDLGEFAGRTIRRIVLVVDPPERGGTEGAVAGWLDDVRIAEREPQGQIDPVDRVRTTRGTHSSDQFSRGNNFPATAVPHGFNFWTPVTKSSVTNWIYEYHRGNNADNRPALEAFALSHEPSPWMGDRHTFHILPGVGEVKQDRKARALAFSHDNETDRPHHYGVEFDNGITTDIAPADHAALFRFAFPGKGGWLLFDNVTNRGGLRLDPAGPGKPAIMTGYTWVKSGLSTGARRMFVYAEFDSPATGGRKLRNPPWRTVTGYLEFETPVVTMRIATSLISLKQAKRNLAQEIPEGTTFDQVRANARQAWADVLGRVEIEGGTDDELTTFYSNLYRLFLYPNSGHELTPSGERHASPVIPRLWPSTRKRTGAKVVDGQMYVNNGFWDTYRTTWPAYALFTPSRCARMIDGFVQQYREGGWLTRWSSPGYANLMTGTSSDVAFADAYLKGVRDFDVDSAYDAAVRNATVTPTSKGVGRKGLHSSIFLGYTPTSTVEGLSWALEGCINDFGIANLSDALAAERGPKDPRHQEYLDNAAYFRQRAQHYVHHFDTRVGFFQGKQPDGRWRAEPDAFNPGAWGGDYVETNAWNTMFSVPHDGPGLASLHGGAGGLESKLDTFFATPETGRDVGAYGGLIHEMTEARDIRLGQFGLSNQPSHHIPYIYNFAGAPAKTQRIVRDVLSRCFLGSELGQGYPGDEDNGEMSAWYVFSALGFYPLAVGSPAYAVGSPLFTKVTIRLENGKDLVVNAPGNDAEHVYVRDLRVDGKPHGVTLAHSAIAGGAVLDFELATEPSEWGVEPVTASAPAPLTDLSGQGRSPDADDVSALFDNTSRTEATFTSATPTVEFTVAGEPRTVTMYTLTSGARRGDPRSWVLEGSADGVTWSVLDERRGQSFRWRRQTRPFVLAEPAAYAHFRLRITEGTSRRVAFAQWELLAELG
jgi:predicted alpha-1,2-mannosidase